MYSKLDREPGPCGLGGPPSPLITPWQGWLISPGQAPGTYATGVKIPDMKLSAERLEELLRALGGLLVDRGARLEAVAIGGGSLLLLGLIRRPTRDLDLVALVDAGGRLATAQPMPTVLQTAVEDVARLYRLDPHWLNAAPTSLIDLGLPDGFMERAERREYGGLVLRLASRRDQIALKLYAAVDQGPDSKHVADLHALTPTAAELLDAARWSRRHDPSDAFRQVIVQALAHFGVVDDGSF